MTDLQLIIDLHKNTNRQGPGSERDTLLALQFCNLPQTRPALVADIGCGSGGQTITLANAINGHITAVDLFPEFLSELSEKIAGSGLSNRITTLEASMDDLPFATEELDLIWSEGAIYNIGFENGVKNWRKFLKPGGYFAVSEITWITSSRPTEIEDYWKKEYPEIDTAANKIKILETHGYSLSGYFNLSSESWDKHYYQPLEAGFDSFLARNGYSEEAHQIIEMYKQEIQLFRIYKEYFSYGFYIARKN